MIVSWFESKILAAGKGAMNVPNSEFVRRCAAREIKLRHYRKTIPQIK